jgi:hypothetical protein
MKGGGGGLPPIWSGKPPLVVGDLPLVVVGQTSYVLVVVEVGDLVESHQLVGGH